MNEKQREKRLDQILAILRQKAANNPYFTFIYDWGIINLSDKVVTAKEVMRCIDGAKFPPIGKN